eukprot:scaffold63574_cov50-Phaeocystis_antarctica.AAC.1
MQPTCTPKSTPHPPSAPALCSPPPPPPPPPFPPPLQANAKPAAAPDDGAPGSGDPALIKMSYQHTKLSQARSEEPAPPKLNDQNTHPMPVRAHNGHRAVPWPEHALRTAISLYSSSLSYPNLNVATEGSLS